MFKASTLMLNKSHYDFRAMPGQKYPIWQTPWEQEMFANLWNRLPACRSNSLLHNTALSSSRYPALLKASSHSLFRQKLLSGHSLGLKGSRQAGNRNLRYKQHCLEQRCLAKDELCGSFRGSEQTGEILLLHTDSLS